MIAICPPPVAASAPPALSCLPISHGESSTSGRLWVAHQRVSYGNANNPHYIGNDRRNTGSNRRNSGIHFAACPPPAPYATTAAGPMAPPPETFNSHTLK